MSLRGPRIESLDAFRGAAIAAMLLVNNPGSWSAVYPPLLHAPWHGWTFTEGAADTGIECCELS